MELIDKYRRWKLEHAEQAEENSSDDDMWVVAKVYICDANGDRISAVVRVVAVLNSEDENIGCDYDELCCCTLPY